MNTMIIYILNVGEGTGEGHLGDFPLSTCVIHGNMQAMEAIVPNARFGLLRHHLSEASQGASLIPVEHVSRAGPMLWQVVGSIFVPGKLSLQSRASAYSWEEASWD